MMLRFEWDSEKARVNLQNHSVSVEDAMHVFEDPYALFEQDRTDVSGETRWHALGLAGGVAILPVVHTVREEGGDETIRLISARQATRKERNRYEQSSTQDIG
jgi:uncharacterized DUF497 family protein